MKCSATRTPFLIYTSDTSIYQCPKCQLKVRLNEKYHETVNCSIWFPIKTLMTDKIQTYKNFLWHFTDVCSMSGTEVCHQIIWWKWIMPSVYVCILILAYSKTTFSYVCKTFLVFSIFHEESAFLKLSVILWNGFPRRSYAVTNLEKICDNM